MTSRRRPRCSISCGEAGLVQQRLDDGGRLAEVADRLEERHRRDLRAGLRGEVDGGQNVLCRLRPGDDHGVDRALTQPALRIRDRSERLSHAR